MKPLVVRMMLDDPPGNPGSGCIRIVNPRLYLTGTQANPAIDNAHPIGQANSRYNPRVIQKRE
jgi:hypothetical protein